VAAVAMAVGVGVCWLAMTGGTGRRGAAPPEESAKPAVQEPAKKEATAKPAAEPAKAEGKFVAQETIKKDVPQLVLSNGVAKLVVYLPDARRGYYRGMRFDWSGLIARAEYAGHTYFGAFRPQFNPVQHDHVVGPADEFDMEWPRPPGFVEAEAGEPFLKIGVGVLEKGPETDYAMTRTFNIREAGPWAVENGPDWVEFRQKLATSGWGYAFTKRISLVPGQGAFVIKYTLANTGEKPIDSLFYVHNFTLIDDYTVGPNYRVTFPFDVKLMAKPVGQVSARGKELVIGEVGEKTPIWTLIESGKESVADAQVTIENLQTHAGLKIVGDQPLAQWRFYAEPTAACPEPFISVKLAPGEAKTWSFTYTFVVESAGEKKAPVAESGK
jgi:hypothetical protein